MRIRLIGTAFAALVLTASAYANVIFTMGNNPQPGEQNIMFHNPQTNTVVNGSTNKTDTLVMFSSNQSLTAKGGQSDVDATNLDLRNITIKAPGEEFNDYILNVFKANGSSNVRITVFTFDGGVFVSPVFGSKGNNFWTITTSGGDEITSITITAGNGVEGIRQNRISGIIEAPIIPEPSSMLLLGSGVLVLAQVLRRKL